MLNAVLKLFADGRGRGSRLVCVVHCTAHVQCGDCMDSMTQRTAAVM